RDDRRPGPFMLFGNDQAGRRNTCVAVDRALLTEAERDAVTIERKAVTHAWRDKQWPIAGSGARKNLRAAEGARGEDDARRSDLEGGLRVAVERSRDVGRVIGHDSP